MTREYEKFLDMITSKVQTFFEKQKPYIFCHKGCSLCCEKGEYPFSHIEYKYLMKGFLELDENTQKKIKEKIEKIKEEKRNYKGEKAFLYECPFLIDKMCSVYKYRGIICRTFGLLVQREGKKPQIPFCSSLGLNYSNVYDVEKRSITPEKFKETHLEIHPLMFNVSYDFLTDQTFAKGYNFEFGDKKALIEWF